MKFENMTQRRISNVRTFQFGVVTLNEILNPNLQFQFVYSQNLFEDHKIIVDNLWSFKFQNFPNQNLEYAYEKTILALAQHLQHLQMLKNHEKQENLIKELETKLVSLNNVNKTELINMVKKLTLLIE